MDYRDRKIVKEEEALTYLKESRLSFSNTYEKSPEILKVGETVIGTLGNFSASIGKAKSKKTFNVSAIVASALCGKEILKYRAQLPEGKDTVLYIDTEQSPYHCMKVLKRIHRLAGLSCEQDCERLQFLALRKFNPEERIAIVEAALNYSDNIGLVIIDGIRDLVYDINSPSESTCVISKLMQWTDEKQIHLHTILHQNKGDENARGHIGTELNNKAETVIQIEVCKEDKNMSIVEAIHIRSMDFTPFAFCINDEALPELVDDYTPQARSVGRPKKEPFDPYRDIKETTHRRALENAFADGDISSYEELTQILKRAYQMEDVKLNNNKIVALVTFLRNKRMILAKRGNYHFNQEYYY